MRRLHIITVAVLLGIAAAAGVIAMSRTTGVGARAHSRTNDAVIAARIRQLDRFELALRRSLRDRPPALPRVPAAGQGPTRSPARAPVSPRIVYRRPAPIVVLRHTSHHDDGGGREAEGGGSD